jgi:hypothetical protein
VSIKNVPVYLKQVAKKFRDVRKTCVVMSLLKHETNENSKQPNQNILLFTISVEN